MPTGLYAGTGKPSASNRSQCHSGRSASGANPVAAVLSVAMCLAHLGEQAAAVAVEIHYCPV